jgi:broad specificity phosphatase PhoE
MIRIILVRHGYTAWNVSGSPGQRFRGIIDLPLADIGLAQARVTARRLAGWRLDAVYSSPLQRAATTAQILAEPHGLAVQTVPGLGSMDYGDWAGLLRADVARRWPDLYSKWRTDPFSVQIPRGESTVDLRERAVGALREILAKHTDGETIVIVSHQVVTKTLVCTLMELPDPAHWHIRQDLCNLTRFDHDAANGEFILVGLNDACHLEPTLPRIGGGGTRLIVVRHGQTAWNVGAGEERFRGRTDLPLDHVGLDQARAVAGRLKDESIAALYASPLLRARQTLAPLAEALGLTVQPHDGLLDIDYGDFQGLTHSQAASTHADAYARWRTRPSQVCFPGGESLDDVQARLLAMMDELLAGHPGQIIVLVGHQIVNKVLSCTLLGLGLDRIWRIRQDTAGIDLFQWANGAWNTLALNDICHLDSMPQA